MKRHALPLLLIVPLAAGCSSTGVPLEPYVGGRVVERAQPPQADAGIWARLVPSGGKDGVSYVYEWPGVYFEAQFTGDSVDVKVDDDQNNLYLWLDGVHKLTLTRGGRTTLSLKDLGPGSHVVRLEKASETQSSTGAFDGFYVPSRSDVLPRPQYGRRIEFIGDSYTVGYGNTSRGQTCTVQDVADTTDTSLAFAPMTAKHFHAAYRINAFSGRGIVRNYSDIAHGDTLPVMYRYKLFDKSAEAKDAGWSPDVVVIGLGTNDFSTELTPTEVWKTRDELHADFQKTYVEFVKTIRAKWPDAHIILWATTGFAGEINAQVTAVADTLKAQNFADFEMMSVDNLDMQSCHFHPSLKDEAILSQMLIDRIAALPRFKAP